MIKFYLLLGNVLTAFNATYTITKTTKTHHNTFLMIPLKCLATVSVDARSMANEMLNKQMNEEKKTL